VLVERRGVYWKRDLERDQVTDDEAYQIVDVDTEERAVEIAALVSAAPGPEGRPMRQPIELRRIMGTLPGAEL
jgi:hypothetical protein